MIERVRLPKRKVRRVANQMTFTERNVLKLRSKKTQFQVWDYGTGAVRGLSILVSPGGTKSYRSTYYFEGSPKPHSRHLGRVVEMSLAKARELCRKDRTDAREGIDPKGSAPGASDSYLSAVKDYVQREQINALGRVSAPGVLQTLLRDTTEWHPRAVALIKPREIQALLESVRDGDEANGIKPRRHLSVALHRRLSGFFAWCVRPGIEKLKFSPMTGIKVPWSGAQPRNKVWFRGQAADDAIKAIWAGADKLERTESVYLKMLLLLGKRKSALAKMRWEEIEPNWFWNAPASATKYKRLHGVPLPALAQRILGKRQASGFVFPGGHDGRIYVDGTAFYTNVRRASGLADFFPHGVRHIVETKLAELKVPPHIRDMVLDHAPARGSGGDYDHHLYRDEMLAALELWARHIEKLVQPKGTALLR